MIQSFTESRNISKRKNTQEHTDVNTLYAEMGIRLRKLRHEKDYTQEQMAEILGISTAYYGKIERGINSLSIKRLYILNMKLGVDITYLVTGKRSNMLSIDEILAECPMKKRYDLEQIIKYALNLIEDT